MTTADELIQDVIDSHRFDKDGELLLADLEELYSRQPLEHRESFLSVFRAWLGSDDSIKAHWAVSLIRRLELYSELGTLENVLADIKSCDSKLPKYFEQFLTPAIEELKVRKGH
jgi:hypothetical protein